MKRILWTISMLTWALPLNIIQTIILLIYLIIYRKSITSINWKYGRMIVWVSGNDFFGGLELGWSIIVNVNSSETLYHELGHTIQMAIWGIFSFLVIQLPSSCRYWYRYYLRKYNYTKYKLLESSKPYNSIWFEKQATKWGERFFK